jgi:serine phosphatase RsbU (regulator of sigma subunit)
VIAEEALEPGDQLLLYTDGIVEARSSSGEEFGVERLIDFATTAAADQLPPPETTRRLVHAILAYQDDRLQDDATVLLAEWRAAAPPDSDSEPVAGPVREPLNLDAP